MEIKILRIVLVLKEDITLILEHYVRDGKKYKILSR
jgi:hypothetical protein